MDKSKLDAAKERLKTHRGGDNLVMFDSPEKAREAQKRSVESRRRNKERLQSLSGFVSDLDKIGADVGAHAPKGIDVMKFLMVQAMHDENFEVAGMYAEKIAQYETPKLSSTTSTEITRDLSDLSEEEFNAELKKLEENKDE